jgi:hypothetical protein
MLVARYTHSEYWEQIYQLKSIEDKIVAWMPLPPSYQGEEKPIKTDTVCKKTTCPYYINPDYMRCKECEEKTKKASDIINDVMQAENIPYEGTDDR